MSLSEARTKGKQLLASTQLDHERVTVQEAYDLFVRSFLTGKKPRTQYDYKRVLNRHYLPTLASKRVDAVSSHMVMAVLDELVGVPSELIHAAAVGKTFFKWCIRRHYITISPLQAMQQPRPKRRKRVLADDELLQVWRTAGEFGGPYGALVKLIILTGLRRRECAALQNDWVLADRIDLPASITKNGRQFCFPTGAMARAILAGLKTNWHLLLPQYPAGPKPFSTFSVTKKQFDKLCTIAPYTLHDLRRTYRTNLARLRVAPHICERLINHASARSELEEIYDHYAYWDEQVEAVNTFDAWLQTLVGKPAVAIAA
jgi:integrase